MVYSSIGIISSQFPANVNLRINLEYSPKTWNNTLLQAMMFLTLLTDSALLGLKFFVNSRQNSVLPSDTNCFA